MLGTMMDYPLTLLPILERAGTLFGTVELVSHLPETVVHRSAYADFYRRSRMLAEALTRAGLRRGERVATLMWNHAWHLEAYFGVPAAGGVTHTLNLRLHPDALAEIANHAGDRMLIVDDLLLPTLEKFRDRTHFERVFVVPLSGMPGKCLPAGYESYEEFLSSATGEFTYPRIAEEEAAAMCYTSGTTGAPKGVVYSHRALALHCLAVSLGDVFALKQRDCVMPIVPMFHVNAWGIPHAATMLGIKQVFPGPNHDPENLLNLLEKESVTFTAAVPTIFMGMLDLLDRHPGRWKLSKDLRAVVGGSAAPESLLRAFDRHGIHLRHSWGMTETTPLALTCWIKSSMEALPEESYYRVRAKQGLPVPFVELRGVSDSGEIPWDGQTMGELQTRGPWIASNYHDLPDQAAEKWTRDGWFRTGDVVTIDPDGYVQIVDRTKDLIKSGGEWISSVALENALMGHPAVREAAVIAAPHPKWHERPIAFVVLRDGAIPTDEELRAFLAPNFSKWQLPDAFLFVAEIPRTSTGKFLKSKLREMFSDPERRPG